MTRRPMVMGRALAAVALCCAASPAAGLPSGGLVLRPPGQVEDRGSICAAGEPAPSAPGPVCAVLLGPVEPRVNVYDALVLTQEGVPNSFDQNGDQFGERLASGDFNGDGIADVAVGAPMEKPSGTPRSGAVFVFQGSAGGPALGHFGPRYESDGGGTDQEGDLFGSGLAAGDFNGDGFDDLAAGAPGKASSGAAGSGAVVIFRGGPNGLSGSVILTQTNAGETSETGDAFGRTLAAGDFNLDGYDDLAVAAPGESLGAAGSTGLVFVFPGSSAGPAVGTTITQAMFLHLSETGDLFGSALATGDFSGDGRSDLAVGIPGKSASTALGAGAVGVLFGSPAGLVAGPWIEQEQALQASETGDSFGAALAAGDLNDDGHDDLIIATPAEDLGAHFDAGLVCDLLGDVSGFTPRECFGQEEAGVATADAALFGFALGAGDLDGDGYEDVVAGAPGSGLGGAAGSGAVFVFASGPLALEASDVLVQEDAGQVSQVGDLLGHRIAVHDGDGDGFSDIAAAARGDAFFPAVKSGSLFFWPGLAATPGVTSGPLMGAVSSTTARVWARADRPALLEFQYKLPAELWPGQTSGSLALTESTDLAGSLTLTGLLPETTYDYRPVLDGAPQPLASGTLRTLRAAGTPGTLTFALGADLRFGQEPYPLLDLVRNRDPDFVLMVGDQMYADFGLGVTDAPSSYARKYRQNWGEAHFKALARQVPLLMTWDDHELNDNWDRGTVNPYTSARIAYDVYQGDHNPPPRIPGEIYYAFEAGDAAFYVIDSRTYRSRGSDPDGPAKTLLGTTQKNDLKAWLLSSAARFKFVVSPVSWNDHSTTGSDSWQGYATERNEIFTFIRDQHLCGVVLLSGDQHWAGAFRLDHVSPHTLYELSPTPLGASTRPRTPHTTPDILFRYDSSRVYGLVTVNSTAQPEQVIFDIHDAQDANIFSLTLTWPDLCPDSDSDTFLDDVDCAPENPAFWSLPGEVEILFSGDSSLSWSAPAVSGGVPAPSYDLLASPSPGDFSAATAACLASDQTELSALDSFLPAEGQARYYLVRAENGCGGALGPDSSGVERLGRTCP